MNLTLDARITHAHDGLDCRGLPTKPESAHTCWFCWAPTGPIPYEKVGRVFCSQEHMRAFYGGRLAEIEQEDAEAAIDDAMEAVEEAEDNVRSAERELEDAEDDLASARRVLGEAQIRAEARRA